MVLVRVGGAASAVASFGLWVLVLVRDVGLNPLNGWTIALGLAASIIALLAPTRPSVVLASIALMVLAMLPALIGGVGLLYLLPIGLLVRGLRTYNSPVAHS